MTSAQLPDARERRRVRDELEETLFVEAGAGSGKTTTLVDRVLALVASGVPMREIAAITFTEKAAAELRDRIRHGLELLLSQSGEAVDDRQRELHAALVAVAGDALDKRCHEALEELDAAAISTLHSFAQRILGEHPVEAGLPPGVEILDEISSDMEFDDRWERFLLELYDHDDLERPILLALRVGIDEKKLRDVARAFNANWDLVLERGAHVPAPIVPVDLDPLLERFDGLTEQLAYHVGEPDSMWDTLEAIAEYRDQLARLGELSRGSDQPDPAGSALDAEVELVASLGAREPRFTTNDGGRPNTRGNKKNWPPEILEDLRSGLLAAGQHRDRLRRDLVSAVVERLAAEVAGFTIDEAERRARAGRLEFHDLLVRARKLLRDPGVGVEVRRVLRGRYSRLLLDEFQDTDPLQIDIALLLAADPEQTGAGWKHLDPTPGRVFFVGDPKQSIYRFRRADIRLFLEASEAFGPAVQLNTNFRSTIPITEWVNEIFGSLIVSAPGSQPPYERLESTREPLEAGPPVSVLGIDPLGDSLSADQVREVEARAVAEAILAAAAEGWTVSDDGATRPARLGDITILIPARTSLPALEQALERVGIPYRAETSSLVYSTRQVRDLMAVLRAVDDPTDELSLVTSLRSVAFGCGDDDLYTFRVEHGGRWNHQAPIPDTVPVDHPVREALEWLAALHERRSWLSSSEIVDTVVRERRFMEYGVAIDSHRDVWRRMRFLVDQARAFTDATGGSLREFLAWAAHQADEQARVAEAVLPETDSDSVRIMTIHAAKGLEFPIAVVSGMTTQVGGRRAGVQVVFPPDGGVGYSFDKSTVTDEFEKFKPLDEQMDFHEKLRLFYVACTRARDHLVVSLHRKARKKEPAREQRTAAELLASVGAAEAAVGLAEGAVDHISPVEAARSALAPFDDWRAELDTALTASSRRRAVAATQIALAATDDPGLQKLGRNLDLPPWKKGRYGTAIGRAVHGLLQTIDLQTGADLDATAAAQAQSEGVAGHEATIARLAAAALASPTVQEAAGVRHWRELFVAVPLGDRLLEGYVDLLYERSDGLVVVDYKTDAWADEAELEEKLNRYRLQGASYATAVQRVTGRPVITCRFLFLSEEGAVARDVPDLAAAVQEVERAVPELVGGGEAGVE